MTTSVLRPTILALSMVAGTTLSPAFAITISREAPPQPIPAAAAVTSPESSMPYACDKSELNTRIQKRTCR